jgi:hypothetical protein
MGKPDLSELRRVFKDDEHPYAGDVLDLITELERIQEVLTTVATQVEDYEVNSSLVGWHMGQAADMIRGMITEGEKK